MAWAMVRILSVPSERAFSVAGDLATKKRNRMVGSTIKLLMLTVTWIHVPVAVSRAEQWISFV